jgi:hypothetical protein
MFDSITKFFADVKATAVVGYETFTGDVTSACANAKADVINQVEVSHVNVSRTYKVVYSCAAAFYKLWNAVANNSYVQKTVAWVYANDLNLNIAALVLSVPMAPVMFGNITTVTVIAMLLSFAAITELFVPVGTKLGVASKYVRIVGYSLAVVKAAIVLGIGALFM